MLASALPLLAEDPAALPSTSNSLSAEEVEERGTASTGTATLGPSHENRARSLPNIDSDDSIIDDDNHQITASEAIHGDESFRLPPLPRINSKSLDMDAPEAASIAIDTGEEGHPSDPLGHEASGDQQGHTKDGEAMQDEIKILSETEEPTAAMQQRTESTETASEINEALNADLYEVPVDTESKSESEAVEVDADGVATSESIRTKNNSDPDASVETETPEGILNEENDSESSEYVSTEDSTEEITSEMDVSEDQAQVGEGSREIGKNATEDLAVEEDDEDEMHSLSQVLVDYASKSAGALIIEKSGSFKGTSNLLNADRDKYAIAPCEEKKFVVVSLSEDILVKQIKLANYERFSSSVKMFQVLGSQTLEKWFDMGSFEAKPGNGEQTFEVKEPAWARYLKFKFMSHHGQEYYCTFSQIKVHGSTMVQGFHEQWEGSADELESENEEEESIENNLSATQELVGQNSTLEEIVDQEQQERIKDASEDSEADNGSEIKSEEPPKDDVGRPVEDENDKDEAMGTDEGVGTGIELLPPSKNLDAKLHGALSDEELFSSLYDLIPSTLNALPVTSRDSPGRQTTGGKMKTLHHFTNAAMKPSASAPAPSDIDGLIADSHVAISTPRMSNLDSNTINLHFGTKVELSVNVSGDEIDEAEKTFESQESSGLDSVKKEQATIPPEDENLPDAQITPDEESSQEVDSNLDSDEKSEVEEVTLAPQSDVPESDDVETLDQHSSDFVDTSLQKMLESLPSAECLSNLNFSNFKAKALAAKKPPGVVGGNAASGANPMEPIFKKLTDEIRLLQSNLSIQDQFTKTSVACYQRVLLELMLQTETLRIDHEKRIRELEEIFQYSYQFYLRKIARILLDAPSVMIAWIYSTILLLFSFITPRVLMICKWFVLIARVSVRLPGIIIHRALQYWPKVRGALRSVEMGPDTAVIIDPLIDHVDQLVVDLQQNDSLADYKEFDIVGDEMWKFPLVPILVLIFVGRLVLVTCFTGSSSRITVSPQQSTQGTPSPKKSPLGGSPSSTKKGVQVGSPGAQPEDNPPALVEEPPALVEEPLLENGCAIPQSDVSQKLVTP